MKISLYFIFVFFFSFSKLLSQETELKIPKNDNNLAEYNGIIDIPNMTKSDLFVSAMEWFNKTYKSGKAVIQTSDKEGGMIIGKANSSTVIYNNMGVKKDGGYFSYTISIYCKDNKFKYVIDNITYNKGDMALSPGADLSEEFPSNWKGWLGDNKQTRREWKSFQKQTNSYFIFIIDELKTYMQNSKSKNDW